MKIMSLLVMPILLQILCTVEKHTSFFNLDKRAGFQCLHLVDNCQA